MAKTLWILAVAACVCQVAATVPAPAPAAHGAAAAHGHGAAKGNGTNKTNGTEAGHGAKGEHGHGEEEKKTGSTPSVILLVGVSFIFALFYMVNSQSVEVTKQTWSAISDGVSIFVAVMFNTMVHKTFFKEKPHHGEEAKEAAAPHEVGHLALKMFLMTVFVCFLLFIQRSSKLRLFAYGKIGGHVLGFAAIDLFAKVANLEVFNSSPWKTLYVILIYIFAVQLLVIPVNRLFHVLGMCCELEDHSKTDLKEAKKQAADTSTDFYCMGASFMLAMFFRGVISGEVVEEEVEGKHHTYTEVWLLALAGVFFMILGGVMRSMIHRLSKKNKDFKEGVAGKLLEVIGTTSSLACAWCFLNSSQWSVLIRFPSDKVIGPIVVALEASVGFIVSVFLLAAIIGRVSSGDVKQTFKGEFTAIGLWLGLAWEHVFDAALEGIEPGFPKPHRSLELGLFTLALVLFVFPAWVVYIVPNHDDEYLGNEHKDKIENAWKKKKLNPLVAFCDCLTTDDSDDSDSEDAEAVE